MDPTTVDSAADVLLFAFRDGTRAAQVAAAAGDETGVRSIAVVGRSDDCELRIIRTVGGELTDARWPAWTLAVLDLLSKPLRLLAGSSEQADAVTLPDSTDGFAAFGRLIPRGDLVILVAVCDDSELAISSLETQLGAAVFQMPADCIIRMSAGRRCSPLLQQIRRLHRTPAELRRHR
jgi:hypothetical protein